MFIKEKRTSLDTYFIALSDIECYKKSNHWMLSKSLTRHQKELITILNLDINTLEKTLK